MTGWKTWNLGAKLLTLSAAGLLLTFGLCSVGAPLEGSGTGFQNFASSAGLLLFVLSAILFLAGILAFLIHLVRDK